MPKNPDYDDQFVLLCELQRAWYDSDGEVTEVKTIENADDGIGGLQGLIDALTNYVVEVQEHEDDAGKGATTEERIKDFILYLQNRG